MVTINGASVCADGKTIADYLAEAGYPAQFIAVERNLQIVPQADYDTTLLCEGDRVEIVRFVGGG